MYSNEYGSILIFYTREKKKNSFLLNLEYLKLRSNTEEYSTYE